MKQSRAAIMPIVIFVLGAAACGKTPPPPPAPASEPAPTVDRDAEERARREAEERARREAEERARLEAERARARATLEEMVFFDFDRSEIRPDARATLDAKVPLLRQDGSIRLRIEGHADERGSTEYNLALGSRRAESVRGYFAGFGLDRGRFETMTFGEERPLAQGHDEASWARNRRAEFRIVSGLVSGQN